MCLARAGSAESEQVVLHASTMALLGCKILGSPRVEPSLVFFYIHSTHRLPDVKPYMNTEEALLFPRMRSKPAVCTSVRHFTLKLMENEADEVKYSKSAEAQQWWISDGSLLLTRFSFAPASPLPCHGPDNMSVQCAHYARRHFPPPSQKGPAEEQASIIHVRDEHKCYSFHPRRTQV